MMKRMTAWKQAAVLGMAVCMTAGLVGCGSKEAADTTADATTEAADTEEMFALSVLELVMLTIRSAIWMRMRNWQDTSMKC